MSPKIDLSYFSLRAINFDNARELEAVSELIQDNLSHTEFAEFKSHFSITEGNLEHSGLVSVMACYEDQPIAHIAFELNEDTGDVILFSPVIDRNFEHLGHFVNSMIWRTLARLSKRQSWGRVVFSSCSYGDFPIIDCIEFRGVVSDLLPGCKNQTGSAASLREQIEVVHGKMEIVQVSEQSYDQTWPNNARI